MAKFDHANGRPNLFKDNELSILPVSFGNYVISRFDVYHQFEQGAKDSGQIISCPLPDWIKSLDGDNIFSESVALNCALAAGIVNDFVGDNYLVPTVSGRMRSGNFDFLIHEKNKQKITISVSNAQIEIDAAYESTQNLVLVEAKNNLLQDDFIIRQLYYPFRTWQSRVNKNVKLIFLTLSNDIYTLREYIFQDIKNYNSIALKKKVCYSIKSTRITTEDIENVLKDTKIISEAAIPFPQADIFERVINICELLNEQEMGHADITENYSFDKRQASYYTDAARYLGLVEKAETKKEKIYTLTKRGKEILRLGYKKRQLAYCQCIFSHAPFHVLMKKWFVSGEMPDKNEIIKIMKESNLYQINSDETYERRSSTIACWLRWIVRLIN